MFSFNFISFQKALLLRWENWQQLFQLFIVGYACQPLHLWLSLRYFRRGRHVMAFVVFSVLVQCLLQNGPVSFAQVDGGFLWCCVCVMRSQVVDRTIGESCEPNVYSVCHSMFLAMLQQARLMYGELLQE